MGVAGDDAAGTENGEAAEADAAHGVLLHAHHADVANPAVG
jgi:hypothetical protein